MCLVRLLGIDEPSSGYGTNLGESVPFLIRLLPTGHLSFRGTMA